MLLNPLSEIRYLVQTVADTVLKAAAQFRVAFHAERLCLPVTVVHQAPIYLLDLTALFLPCRRHRQRRKPARFSVPRGQLRRHCRGLHLFTLPIGGQVGHYLIVLLHKAVFLVEQRNKAAVKAPLPVFHYSERLRAECIFKLRPERGIQKQPVKLAEQLCDFRTYLIIIILLRRVELVVHIHIMPLIAQLYRRHIRLERI